MSRRAPLFFAVAAAVAEAGALNVAGMRFKHLPSAETEYFVPRTMTDRAAAELNMLPDEVTVVGSAVAWFA